MHLRDVSTPQLGLEASLKIAAEQPRSLGVPAALEAPLLPSGWEDTETW